MLAAAVALWVDALLGGASAGDAWALPVMAVLALLSGLVSRPVVLAVAALAVVVLLAVADQVGSPGQFALADDGVFYAVVVGAPALTGALVAVRSAAVHELRARRVELMHRRAIVVRAARAAEVERVEREVDDALADRLRGIVDGVAEASSRAVRRPEAVPIALALVEASARAALELMRDVLGVLRPPKPTRTTEPVAATLARPRRRRVVDQVDALLVLAIVPLIVETALPGRRGPVWLNVMLALAQGLLLTVVRRRPVMGAVMLLALACVQSAVLTPLPPTVSWLLPGLLLVFLVGHGPDRRTAWVGLIVTLGGVGLLTLVTPAPHRSLDGFAPGLVMGRWPGSRVVPWPTGRRGPRSSARSATSWPARATGRRGSRPSSSERSWLANFMTWGRTR